MKRLTLIIGIAAMYVGALFSQNPIDKIFDKYAEMDGFTVVDIAGTVKVLSVEDSTLNKSLNFYDELIPELNEKNYMTFMNVKEKDEKVRMMADTVNGGMLIVVGGINDNTIVWIGGGIQDEETAKILKQYGMEGLSDMNFDFDY